MDTNISERQPIKDESNLTLVETKKKKMPTKPMKELSNDQLLIVKNAAVMGMTHEQIAKLLDISVTTLRRMIKRDEKLKHYMERGKSLADTFVMGKLLELIDKGNVASTIFYLKTRCGWKETEKKEIEMIPKDEIVSELNTQIFS